MLSNKKSDIEKYLDPLIRSLSELNPNYLTLIGSIPSLLFFVFVISHQYVWAIVAFLGNIFDFLDGMVARKYHKVTQFGGFLDSTLDRVADFFIIAAFGYGKIVRWEIVVPLLFVSFLISYIRSRGELASGNKILFNVGIIERTERLVLVIFSLLLYMITPAVLFNNLNLAEWVFLVLIALSCYTIAQRVAHAYKKL